MAELHKENVTTFNQDVATNQGYRYTTNAPFSAQVANRTISQAVWAFVTQAPQTIIDLGCGDGTYTQELAECWPHATVHGNDPAEVAVQMAQERYPHIAFALANVLVADTLPNTVYDVGVLRGVIHHLPDDSQQTAFANARRVCRQLIVVEPNGNSPILKVIERTSRYHIEHQEQSFSTETLVGWAKQAGWAQVDVKYVGLVPMFCPEWLARMIYAVQPIVERIPGLNKYMCAQIILSCRA